MLVTKWELHERSTLRYTVMAIIVIAVIVLSIMTTNWTGVILMVFLVWGYLFYSTFATERLQLTADSQGIQLGNQRGAREAYVGYVLEVDQASWLLRNIVLIRQDSYDIHTILVDENDPAEIERVVMLIDQNLPLLEWYAQKPIDIMMRKFKI